MGQKIKQILRRPVDEAAVASLGLDPLLARIYNARGVSTPESLERSLKYLLPYQTLSNIDAAVDLLESMMVEQKRILIIGDFDADGATSSALAVQALREFGAQQVGYMIPNRFKEGYGLSPAIVDKAAEKKPDLIITVDNGISSIEGVDKAKSLGIRVLITDHHLPGPELPHADVIVNPNLPGDEFPSKNLAGVGVIFYLMLALRNRLRETNWYEQNELTDPNMADYLDLVALGTVADVVPLDDNNRRLVYQGLMRIRAGKARLGLKALLAVSQRDVRHITSTDLGYAVGPRLNAAGRLDDMAMGVACLLSKDPAFSDITAAKLHDLNMERRQIEGDMQQRAIAALKKLELADDLPFGLCLHDSDWHQGVIGILAARLKERVNRPVVVFTDHEDGELKGSARSIDGFHIRDALEEIDASHPDLIIKFGGHSMAAGLSITKDKLDIFKQAFDEIVRARIDEDSLNPTIKSDGELTGEQINMETAKMLQQAGPWGQGFPEPVFDGTFRLVEQRQVGQRHLKMTLQAPNSYELIHAIAFNVDLEVWPNYECEAVRIAYRLDINEFRGSRDVQLIVNYLEPANELEIAETNEQADAELA